MNITNQINTLAWTYVHTSVLRQGVILFHVKLENNL